MPVWDSSQPKALLQLQPRAARRDEHKAAVGKLILVLLFAAQRIGDYAERARRSRTSSSMTVALRSEPAPSV